MSATVFLHTSEPARVSVLGDRSGRFLSLNLGADCILHFSGFGAEGVARARQLATAITQAADHLEALEALDHAAHAADQAVAS